jgi:hypothetical protein
MRQLYQIPSIEISYMSKFYLVKNQASCELGSVPLAQEAGYCAYTGFGLDANTLSICLTDPNFDTNLLEGLILNMDNGGPLTTGNCFKDDPDVDCPNSTHYVCSVNGTPSACVASIECQDGSLLATCSDLSDC